MAKVELNVPQVPFSKSLVRPTVLVCSFYVTSSPASLYHPVDEDERLSIVWYGKVIRYGMVWYGMAWYGRMVW